MQVQALVDRIEQLEEILGQDRSLVSRLSAIYNLERMHAQIIGIFFKREYVTREGLYIVLFGMRPESDQPTFKFLDLQMHKLRNRLCRGKHRLKIVTKRGEGWQMTRDSRAAIVKALNEHDDLQIKTFDEKRAEFLRKHSPPDVIPIGPDA